MTSYSEQLKSIVRNEGFITLESLNGTKMTCSEEHFNVLYQQAMNKNRRQRNFTDKGCLDCEDKKE